MTQSTSHLANSPELSCPIWTVVSFPRFWHCKRKRKKEGEHLNPNCTSDIHSRQNHHPPLFFFRLKRQIQSGWWSLHVYYKWMVWVNSWSQSNCGLVHICIHSLMTVWIAEIQWDRQKVCFSKCHFQHNAVNSYKEPFVIQESKQI